MSELGLGLKALPGLARLDARVSLGLRADEIVAPVPDLVVAVVEAGELDQVLPAARTLIPYGEGDSFARKHLSWFL